MPTYIVTNDAYSNHPGHVTFDQLVGMAAQRFSGAAAQLEESTTEFNGQEAACIKNELGEVVAVEKAAFTAN